MSQLNVGTLNVGTTQFTGDSSTLNTAPPTSLSGFVTGTPQFKSGIDVERLHGFRKQWAVGC